MIRSSPAAALPNSASKMPACFATKRRSPAGSARPVKNQPTAFAFGNELTNPLPTPHRAVLVLSDLEKAVILLPFAKILLPSHPERPELATHEAADTAATVDLFLKLKGGVAVQPPEAGRVGDERPNRRRRLGEMRFTAVAENSAVRLHAALRIAKRAPSAIDRAPDGVKITPTSRGAAGGKNASQPAAPRRRSARRALRKMRRARSSRSALV
jgi:hypothetical protein